MNWGERKNEIKRKEIRVLLFVLFLLIFGVVGDVLNLHNKGVILVANLDAITLVFLQIQATVTALSLTIIALLSGNISSSFMGVSISRFYLEIRPFWFKLKMVILAEFVSLAISAGGQLIGAYNFVISLFLSSMVLIVASTFEIYEAFKGKGNALEEIQSYIEDVFENGNEYRDLTKAFISDWKGIAPTQSKEEFDHYSKIFFILFERILNKEQSIEDINSYSENLARYLLEHEFNSCRLEGLRFVNDFYEGVWKWINDHKEKALAIHTEVELLDRIYYEWFAAMDSIDSEMIEGHIRLDSFSEMVIRVASWIGFSEDKTNKDVQALNRIAKTLGLYIDKQKMKGNLVNNRYWEGVLADRLCRGAYGIPEGRESYYMESMALKDFCVYIGFLLNGHIDMIQNGVYLDGINHIYSIDSESLVFRVMLMHCFMYYLAFRESTDCIDEGLQHQIQQVMVKKEVVDSISRFYNYLYDNDSFLNEQLEKRLEETIHRFEIFPKHSDGKWMISEDVAREYFLYVALMIARFPFKRNKLAELLNTQQYYGYLLGQKHIALRNTINDMHKIFSSQALTEEDASKQTDAMLSAFDIVIKNKYKKSLIEEAVVKQREYEEQGLEIEIEKNLKKYVKECIGKTISDFRVPCKSKNTYRKVHIFTVHNFTRWIANDSASTYSDGILAGFFIWLISVLKATYGINIMKRSECFESDDEFRGYLKANHFNVLMGSQYAFGCIDYMNYEEHSDFLSEMDCHFVNGFNGGLALRDKALYVKINDAYVEVSSPGLEEIDATRDSETGIYSYSPSQGITLDFEESELKSFVHDEKKVINIYINVTIGMSETEDYPQGAIIMR